MSLTLNEVRRCGEVAYNYTQAYHDEHGMDWDHWFCFPEHRVAEHLVAEHLSDGHDYAGLYSPRTGWIHGKGCRCVYSPRCQEGVHTHTTEGQN